MGVRKDLKRAKQRGDLASRVPTELVREDGRVCEVRTGSLVERPTTGSVADIPYVNAAEAPDTVVLRRKESTPDDPAKARGGWRPVTAEVFAREPAVPAGAYGELRGAGRNDLP